MSHHHCERGSASEAIGVAQLCWSYLSLQREERNDNYISQHHPLQLRRRCVANTRHAAKNSSSGPPFWAGGSNPDNLHNMLLAGAIFTLLFFPLLVHSAVAHSLPVYVSKTPHRTSLERMESKQLDAICKEGFLRVLSLDTLQCAIQWEHWVLHWTIITG